MNFKRKKLYLSIFFDINKQNFPKVISSHLPGFKIRGKIARLNFFKEQHGDQETF